MFQEDAARECASAVWRKCLETVYQPLKQTQTVEQPEMMRDVNIETMLTNKKKKEKKNQHNQPAVAWKEAGGPDIILVEFCVLLLPSAPSPSSCLSVFPSP